VCLAVGATPGKPFSPRSSTYSHDQGETTAGIPVKPEKHPLERRAQMMATERTGAERAICSHPRCERTAEANEMRWCALHVAEWDARARLEGWNFAESILAPWVESTRAIGSEELTRVMVGALSEVERQVERHQTELDRAMAALDA
jgi:hypothetical protein